MTQDATLCTVGPPELADIGLFLMLGAPWVVLVAATPLSIVGIVRGWRFVVVIPVIAWVLVIAAMVIGPQLTGAAGALRPSWSGTAG